jgi:transaldolase
MKYKKKLNNLNIEIFADGPDISDLKDLNKMDFIKGFTTNPSLIRKSGITNYRKYALNFIKNVKNKPVSFEVVSDNFKDMYKEAKILNSWAENINVKIPITNSKGRSSLELVKKLQVINIKCNITAVFTKQQIDKIYRIIDKNNDLIISIFAGRIADTGQDPSHIVKYAINKFKNYKKVKILWASPREILNIFQANDDNCHIITIGNDLLKKLVNIDKNLNRFSLETVLMFLDDAKKANLKIIQ